MVAAMWGYRDVDMFVDSCVLRRGLLAVHGFDFKTRASLVIRGGISSIQRCLKRPGKACTGA